jgi:hypothetical protein
MLKHKFSKVRRLGYSLSVVYYIYLICLTFFPNEYLMSVWLVFYVGLKSIVMHGLWNMSCIKFSNEVFTFWNLLDFMRLGSLLGMIICQSTDYISDANTTNTASFAVCISWILSLETLRIFPRFMFILTLIKQSIREILEFGFVLLLVN